MCNKNISRNGNDNLEENVNIEIAKEAIGEKKLEDMEVAELKEVANVLEIADADKLEKGALIEKIKDIVKNIPITNDNAEDSSEDSLAKKSEKSEKSEKKLKCPGCFSDMKEKKHEYVCTNKKCNRVEKKPKEKTKEELAAEEAEKKEQEKIKKQREAMKDPAKRLGDREDLKTKNIKCPSCLFPMKIERSKTKKGVEYYECQNKKCLKRMEIY